jgi:hypothetical protein
VTALGLVLALVAALQLMLSACFNMSTELVINTNNDVFLGIFGAVANCPEITTIQVGVMSDTHGSRSTTNVEN